MYFCGCCAPLSYNIHEWIVSMSDSALPLAKSGATLQLFVRCPADCKHWVAREDYGSRAWIAQIYRRLGGRTFCRITRECRFSMTHDGLVEDYAWILTRPPVPVRPPGYVSSPSLEMYMYIEGRLRLAREPRDWDMDRIELYRSMPGEPDHDYASEQTARRHFEQRNKGKLPWSAHRTISYDSHSECDYIDSDNSEEEIPVYNRNKRKRAIHK